MIFHELRDAGIIPLDKLPIDMTAQEEVELGDAYNDLLLLIASELHNEHGRDYLRPGEQVLFDTEGSSSSYRRGNFVIVISPRDFYEIVVVNAQWLDAGPWHLLSGSEQRRWKEALEDVLTRPQEQINDEIEQKTSEYDYDLKHADSTPDDEAESYRYYYVLDLLDGDAPVVPDYLRRGRSQVGRSQTKYAPKPVAKPAAKPAAKPEPRKPSRSKIQVGNHYLTKVSGEDVEVVVVQDRGGRGGRYLVARADNGRLLSKLRSAQALHEIR